jgi:hypothetical protein
MAGRVDAAGISEKNKFEQNTRIVSGPACPVIFYFFIEDAHADFRIDHVLYGCSKRTFDDLVAQSERDEQVVLFFIGMDVSRHDSVYSGVCVIVNSVVYFYYPRGYKRQRIVLKFLGYTNQYGRMLISQLEIRVL